jgi:hypothetical protein
MKPFFDLTGENLLDGWRNTLGRMRQHIEVERAATAERVARLALEFGHDRKRFKAMERKEWGAFADRARPIELEIETMTMRVAAWVGTQDPPPLLVTGD